MSANYNSKKKADLEALLKERGLPHSGNKPDLVARLQEDDAKKGGAESGAVTTARTAEEEIDWDDDDANAADSNLAAAQETENPAHKAALEAGGIDRVDNPVDVPNQIVDEANEPGKTDDTVVNLPAETDTTAAAAKPDETTAEDAEAKKKAYEEKFGAHLATTEADEEAAKRKKRAERFAVLKPEGAPKEDESAEATSSKNNDSLIKKLDGALPERRERKRGRDRGDVGRGGVNKRVDSRRRDNRPRGPPRPRTNDADREAMKRRTERFAKAI